VKKDLIMPLHGRPSKIDKDILIDTLKNYKDV